MSYRIIYPEGYIKRVKKFLRRHPEIRNQYGKTLELLEINPYHPSLRIHKLQGGLSDLSSVSINLRYRILLEMVIQENDIILVDIGTHDQVY